MKKYMLSTTTALIISAGSALTVSAEVAYPKLKTGEWELSVVTQGMPMSMKAIYCIDETTQDNMIAQSQTNAQCDKPKLSQQGSTYFAEVRCKMGEHETLAKTETTIVGDSEIHVKGVVTATGQPPVSMKSDGKYLGACKNGRKPGDMVMVGPEGEINLGNIEQIQKMGLELEKKLGKK